MTDSPSREDSVVILGAGYAGLQLAHDLARKSGGRVPVVLVDRHAFTVLRTELYKVGEFAARDGAQAAAVPIATSSDGSLQFRAGWIRSIDLARRVVELEDAEVPYAQLAICLGSDAAFYGVPGAEEFTHQVYHYGLAESLAKTLRDLEEASAGWSGDRRPRVVIVGGGSTGTEVAAEIATTNWEKVTGHSAKAPEVTLVCGELPLLSGLPPKLIRHARDLLEKAGVTLNEGENVVRVDRDRLTLKGGDSVPFDVCIWAAGIQASPTVRALPIPHGHGGRAAVEASLEVKEHPGIFALGDAAEVIDPKTGAPLPALAAVALAEAPVAASNILARREGRPLAAFRYAGKGTIVAVGRGQASGALRGFSIWGRPASILKAAVQREVAAAQRRGTRPPLS